MQVKHMGQDNEKALQSAIKQRAHLREEVERAGHLLHVTSEGGQLQLIKPQVLHLQAAKGDSSSRSGTSRQEEHGTEGGLCKEGGAYHHNRGQ